MKINDVRTELSEAEKARRKQIRKEKLPTGPPRKSARMQNLDPDSGLKVEPIHHFTNKNYSSNSGFRFQGNKGRESRNKLFVLTSSGQKMIMLSLVPFSISFVIQQNKD